MPAPSASGKIHIPHCWDSPGTWIEARFLYWRGGQFVAAFRFTIRSPKKTVIRDANLTTRETFCPALAPAWSPYAKYLVDNILAQQREQERRAAA